MDPVCFVPGQPKLLLKIVGDFVGFRQRVLDIYFFEKVAATSASYRFSLVVGQCTGLSSCIFWHNLMNYLSFE
jgi:hypothetical protein